MCYLKFDRLFDLFSYLSKVIFGPNLYSAHSLLTDTVQDCEVGGGEEGGWKGEERKGRIGRGG